MSGNVAEWTSTPVVVGGQTQYQARGGNYSSDTGGTACDATPVLQSPLTSQNGLGFRCCSNNPP